MINKEGFFDWAIIYPGPQSKSGYPGIKDSNAQGVVYHSAEGSAASLLSLVTNLDRQASWTASNMKDGKFYQHYPVTRIVWTNGSKEANIRFRGVESEGVKGEPLTAAQTENLIRCAEDMRDFFKWPGFRRNIEAWEHNQMTAFGAAATACPSGRIPWDKIMAGLEDDVSKEDVIAALRDSAAFPELNGKSLVEHIQAMDNYILRQIATSKRKGADAEAKVLEESG